MNHLNHEQIDHLRDQLRHRYDALREALAAERPTEPSRRFRAITGGAGDALDASAGATAIRIANARMRLHIAEIRSVEASLSRIDEGIYGICIACGRDIEVGRLKVYPASLRCTPCQTDYEKKLIFAGS